MGVKELNSRSKKMFAIIIAFMMIMTSFAALITAIAGV